MNSKPVKNQRTFWSTANEAFNAKERSQYNRVKIELYTASDRLKSALPIGGAIDSEAWRQELLRERWSELHALICEMPTMEGDR